MVVCADEVVNSPASSVAIQEMAMSCDVDPAVAALPTRRRTLWARFVSYYSRHVHPTLGAARLVVFSIPIVDLAYSHI